MARTIYPSTQYLYDTISLIETKFIKLQSKITVDNNNYRLKLSLSCN